MLSTISLHFTVKKTEGSRRSGEMGSTFTFVGGGGMGVSSGRAPPMGGYHIIIIQKDRWY